MGSIRGWVGGKKRGRDEWRKRGMERRTCCPGSKDNQLSLSTVYGGDWGVTLPVPYQVGLHDLVRTIVDIGFCKEYTTEMIFGSTPSEGSFIQGV